MPLRLSDSSARELFQPAIVKQRRMQADEAVQIDELIQIEGEMKMKAFDEPLCEIMLFGSDDVITTSGESFKGGDNNSDEDDM